MYWRISSVADEVPYSSARSFSWIPGPWSEKRIVLPPSRMVIVGDWKYAWMKFSTISRMTMKGIVPPCSCESLFTVPVISSRYGRTSFGSTTTTRGAADASS